MLDTIDGWLGSLFTLLFTRSDITYAVGVVSQFMQASRRHIGRFSLIFCGI